MPFCLEPEVTRSAYTMPRTNFSLELCGDTECHHKRKADSNSIKQKHWVRNEMGSDYRRSFNYPSYVAKWFTIFSLNSFSYSIAKKA